MSLTFMMPMETSEYQDTMDEIYILILSLYGERGVYENVTSSIKLGNAGL